MSVPHCHICQTQLKAFRPTVENRTYYDCPECQWISLDPGFVLSFEKQRERYTQHENSDQNPGYVAMFEEFIDTCVEPFTKKGSRILDHGCGPEPVLAGLLEKRGHEVKVYDLFFKPDEQALSEKYDLIVMTEVLEHLWEPVEELKKLKALLNPRGVISIMTLFHPNDREGFSKWWYRRDKTHVTFYTVKTIEKLAEGLGLELIYSDGQRTAVLGLKP